MCLIVSVWPDVSSLQVKDFLWLFKQVGFARPSCRDQNTQEVPGKVDRQDHGQRQQANHCHEQDDVALEGQVRDGVDAAFAANLFIPAATDRGNFHNPKNLLKTNDSIVKYPFMRT